MAGQIIDGVLLLDKAQGVSSHKALQQVKRLFKAAKAGHTGSLDPLATGLLPLCFGQATKYSQCLLDANKRYVVSAKLGQTTDTLDAEGTILRERPWEHIRLSDIEVALAPLRGPILQVPPMYSALKRDGVPLYKLAVQGQEVERAARPVTIFELKLIRVEGDTVTLEVACSKGTYIRSLVDSLGEALGCGAHVTSLRRLEHGNFHLSASITLEELSQASSLESYLKPVESLVESLPRVALDAEQTRRLTCGLWVHNHDLSAGLYRLYSPEGFLGLGEVLSEDSELVLKAKRLMSQPII